jgi:hypothetical protein
MWIVIAPLCWVARDPRSLHAHPHRSRHGRARRGCYLFGVWSIGRAMGELQKGRLIQPTLASALRRVGLSLGLGGVLQRFRRHEPAADDRARTRRLSCISTWPG